MKKIIVLEEIKNFKTLKAFIKPLSSKTLNINPVAIEKGAKRLEMKVIIITMKPYIIIIT